MAQSGNPSVNDERSERFWKFDPTTRSDRTRIERALSRAVARITAGGCPPRLAQAVRDSVFPAGGRLRPQLCFAVAHAVGEDRPGLTDAAASAIELLHCASLIQDDLPFFDDAAVRRNRPAVHRLHGTALTVLAADALIVGAFETLALPDASGCPDRVAALSLTLARGAGAPAGAVAGQGWESESDVALEPYHRAKTGSLFEASCMAGAIAAGSEPGPWAAVGSWLGRAYQLADDLADAGHAGAAGSDAAMGRPNAARELGVPETGRVLDECVRKTVASIPACPGRSDIVPLLVRVVGHFRPEGRRDPGARADHRGSEESAA